MQKTLFFDEEIETVNTENKTKRLLVMDAGERQSSVKVYDSYTDTQVSMSVEEYINIFKNNSFNGVSFDEHDLIYDCSELAHWLLQNDISLAQILTKKQMCQKIDIMSKSKKFKMIAWSEKMTPAALKLANLPKDIGDSRAIAHWIQYHNYYDKMKKVESIEDLQMSEAISIGNDWRSNVTNVDINKAQKVNYGLIKKHTFIQNYDICPVMRDIILPSWDSVISKFPQQLSKLWKINDWEQAYKRKKTLANHPTLFPHITQHRHLIGVGERKATTKLWNKGDIFIKDWIPEMRGIYAAFNGVFDYHGNARPHPMRDDCIVSNNWLHDHYMRESQYHQKGGVARAIHYHFIFPRYVSECWEDIHGKKTWPKYSTNYTCPHTGDSKRHNRGSLTKEQDDFLCFHRTQIRKMIRDNIWSRYNQ